MADVSLVALLIRTGVSLAIVLAVVAVAYVIARRRASGGGARVARRPGRGRARRTPGRAPSGRRARTPGSGIEVVGRAGLTRGATAVAVRFGDRVVLIGASEQGPSTVLAEMDGDQWDELHTVREPFQPAIAEPGRFPSESSAAGADPGGARLTFLDALREATARHA